MTNPTPDSRTIREFHRNCDVDSRPEAQHHTLGLTRNQASEGSHIHDGISSRSLLENINFTGSRVNDSATILNQIMVALSQLGATNSTTG